MYYSNRNKYKNGIETFQSFPADIGTQNLENYKSVVQQLVLLQWKMLG